MQRFPSVHYCCRPGDGQQHTAMTTRSLRASTRVKDSRHGVSVPALESYHRQLGLCEAGGLVGLFQWENLDRLPVRLSSRGTGSLLL